MIDAERMGLGFDPSYCASSFFLFLASIHMSYMTSLSGTRQFVYMQFGYTLYWIYMVIQYQLSMLLFSDDITHVDIWTCVTVVGICRTNAELSVGA